jgi:hypothetical protein
VKKIATKYAFNFVCDNTIGASIGRLRGHCRRPLRLFLQQGQAKREAAKADGLEEAELHGW